MANTERDKENNKQMPSLLQAIQLKFSSDDPTKSSCVPQLIIPQLKIPQLQFPSSLTKPSGSATAEEESRRAVDAHNTLLLNEIKRRRAESEAIPAPAAGEPLAAPPPDLLEQGVDRLHIATDEGGDRAQATTPLIDLTTTVIPNSQGVPPRESASKTQLTRVQNIEHFDIPFIACDSVHTAGLLACRISNSMDEDAHRNECKIHLNISPSPVGHMLDAVVGYPRPRRPLLRYASSPLEWQHLKIFRHLDYGSPIKRFRFDTPSPDEAVKNALLKSLRISRT